MDLKNRIIKLESADTKDNEARDIPICSELLDVFEKLPRSISDPHVFIFRGKQVVDIRSALRRVCKKASIPYGRFIPGGFVFHDLRHSFNTNMRKAGVPESVIMKITGHSTRLMFDRYNTIDEGDIQEAAVKLEEHLTRVYK